MEENNNDLVEEVIVRFYELPKEILLVQSQNLMLLRNINICISGGAKGADTIWNELSTKYEHFCFVMSFENHHYSVPKVDSIWKRTKVILLSDEELQKANSMLQQANLLLNRKSYNHDLLRRNFYQVKYAQSLYCIAPIISMENFQNYCVQIEGGTAWACQIFVLENLKHVLFTKRYSLPMYCYDLNTRNWYQCHIFQSQSLLKLKWESIENPPIPSGLYCAIGSRDLLNVSTLSIESIYKAPV